MSSNEKTLPSILESFVIAFSMYSRIPMPFVEWSECGMKYAFCFFPLIGVVIGACVCAFCWLSVQAGLGILAFSLLGTAVPLLITGGIHMDGFLDVTDARSSFQSRERKLEILKDPSRRSLCHCRVRCLSAAVRGSLFRAASGGLSGHWRNLCDDTGPERSFGSLLSQRQERMDWQPRLPKEPETEHRQSKQCWQSGFWWELRLYFWYPVPSRQWS